MYNEEEARLELFDDDSLEKSSQTQPDIFQPQVKSFFSR